MGNTPGARTHRSWWVARAAVKTVNRSSGKTTLLLLNDIEVPVSRGFLAELREAGWFSN
jgi:DNA-binding LytR/AlgR family response regulator